MSKTWIALYKNGTFDLSILWDIFLVRLKWPFSLYSNDIEINTYEEVSIDAKENNCRWVLNEIRPKEGWIKIIIMCQVISIFLDRDQIITLFQKSYSGCPKSKSSIAAYLGEIWKKPLVSRSSSIERKRYFLL